ncbi:MAG: transcription termination factor NusA [Aggregatilineales bacterium]
MEARFNPSTGRERIFVEKEVAEQDDYFSQATEVTLEDARFYEPEANYGDMVMVQVQNPPKKFGRIAAQTAKQVILQKIREAERESLYEEFISREGDLLTGTVQSTTNSMVTLSLGRAEAILPRAQQIPRERYRQHEKLRVYLLEVRRTTRGPQIICSRSHRHMLRRLLEYEVPEIYNGQVEVKSIAREAGYRSKVAVAALQDGVDPVGACVGMRGIRIQNIVKELNDEKIDVIEWDPRPETFIARALSPARVTGVYLDIEETDVTRTAVVIVPEEQLSLAIGREGQNARLAAKLTGWRIDIKSVSETVQTALARMDEAPLDDLLEKFPVMVTDAMTIVDKCAHNLAVMPEEFKTLGKFADIVERRMLEERRKARLEEEARIQAVRETIPEALFEVPLSVLELEDSLARALESGESVGAIMLMTLVDEKRLQRLLRKEPEDSQTKLQEALDALIESGVDFAALIPSEEGDEVEVESGDESSDVDVTDATDAEVAAEAPDVATSEENEDDEEVVLTAFGGARIDEEEPEAAQPEAPVAEEDDEQPALEAYIETFKFGDDETIPYDEDQPEHEKALKKKPKKHVVLKLK